MPKYTEKARITTSGGRKYVILGQQKTTISQAIREITGWTKKEFETQKRYMRYKVEKLNLLTGSNLSPIEQLYYNVRFKDLQKYYASQGKPVLELNPLQKALEKMKTGKLKLETDITKGRDKKAYLEAEAVAKEFILARFEGLGKAYDEAQAVLDQLKADEITANDAKAQLEEIAEKMRDLKQTSPEEYIEAHNENYGS